MRDGLAQEPTGPTALAGPEQTNLSMEPLACVEIVGLSVLERTIRRFLRAGVDVVSVLAEAGTFYQMPRFRPNSKTVAFQDVTDLGSAVSRKLSEYSQNGIEHSFINAADAYTETDLLDLFYFHREARQAVTRAYDRQDSLDLWVADCAKAQNSPLDISLNEARRVGASYFVRGYVNRLTHPRDLRQFAVDTLRKRLELGPSGQEIRPGVWIDDGAEIYRKARIVAPAYIGRGSKLLEESLITRCTSIENNCCVDCGTVIEDSSILANTNIGIWLDVRNALVNENTILSLGRDVAIEIPDASIIRSSPPTRRVTSVVRIRDSRKYRKALRTISDVNEDVQEPAPMPGAWQLDANFIQE